MATPTQGCSSGKVGYSLDELEYALCSPSAIRYGLWNSFATTPLWVFTVAVRPLNENPVLSNQYLDELGSMLPQDFLQHVMKELTPNERKLLMAHERWRRKSFLAGWPHEGRPNQTKNAMAGAGLYYLGEADRVQCPYCKGILFNWETEDIPMLEHSKLFTHCTFPRSGASARICGRMIEAHIIPYTNAHVDGELAAIHNIRYNLSFVSREGLDKVTVYGHLPLGHNSKRNPNCIDLEALGISPHIGYSQNFFNRNEHERLESFLNWPNDHIVSGSKLAEAGFFWSQSGNFVGCFHCEVKIYHWAKNDDPWAEHARWSPECTFLYHKKGRQYIEKINATTDPKKKCAKRNWDPRDEVETATEVCVGKQWLIKEAVVKMGYDVKLVDQAFLKSGGYFNNASDTINMIKELPNSDSILSGYDPGCMFGDVPRPAVSFNLGQKPKYKQGCKDCEILRDVFEPATNIALPCGHLIFCDACAAVSKARAEANLSKANTCPYYGCCNPLSGTMRVETVKSV